MCFSVLLYISQIWRAGARLKIRREQIYFTARYKLKAYTCICKLIPDLFNTRQFQSQNAGNITYLNIKYGDGELQFGTRFVMQIYRGCSVVFVITINLHLFMIKIKCREDLIR